MPPEWTTACPDWERRIVAGESLIPFPPLFKDKAFKDSLFQFRELRIVDAPGSPTVGQACRPWIIGFAEALFGSYDAKAGRMLISEYFLCVSKKNWKSGLAASIMLTALNRNWRKANEFLILSPTIEIAGNSFGAAREMVRCDEELSDLLHVQEHTRTITHRNTHATLKVVAADNDTVGGKKGAGVLIDEAWLFGKRANAENMLREATGGQASRPEGFTIWLTTQSDDPPAGIFKQKLDYARAVRDGRIEDRKFLPVIYEFPQSMIDEKAHLDPANFYVTNPNLGASVDPEFLRRGLMQAQEAGEDSLRGFLAKHLNVEIGLALRSNRWAGAEFWEPCAVSWLTLDELIRRSDVAVFGIDGGGLDDLLGAAAIGRDAETGDWLAWAHAWAHPIVLDRNKQHAPRIRDFERAGDLTIVARVGQDIEEVADIAQKIDKSGLLDRVGVDPAGIGSIVDALTEREILTDRIVGIPQGWKLNGAIKTAERKLAERSMLHSGSPLMAWCVGNARVEPRGNAVTITKQAAAGKIDPLMAVLNCVALMAMNPQPRRRKLILMTLG